MNLDYTLKWLGVIWSVLIFGFGASFFFGGEWEKWNSLKEKPSELQARLIALEQRVEGISLKVTEASVPGQEGGCTQTIASDPTSTIVMYGQYVGGCGATTKNLYKRIDLFNSAAQAIDRCNMCIARD